MRHAHSHSPMIISGTCRAPKAEDYSYAIHKATHHTMRARHAALHADCHSRCLSQPDKQVSSSTRRTWTMLQSPSSQELPMYGESLLNMLDLMLRTSPTYYPAKCVIAPIHSQQRCGNYVEAPRLHLQLNSHVITSRRNGWDGGLFNFQALLEHPQSRASQCSRSRGSNP